MTPLADSYRLQLIGNESDWPYTYRRAAAEDVFSPLELHWNDLRNSLAEKIFPALRSSVRWCPLLMIIDYRWIEANQSDGWRFVMFLITVSIATAFHVSDYARIMTTSPTPYSYVNWSALQFKVFRKWAELRIHWSTIERAITIFDIVAAFWNVELVLLNCPSTVKKNVFFRIANFQDDCDIPFERSPAPHTIAGIQH